MATSANSSIKSIKPTKLSPSSPADPLIVQHLKLPQSVINNFRIMAESDQRTITWLYRNVLEEKSGEFGKQLAADKAKRQMDKKNGGK